MTDYEKKRLFWLRLAALAAVGIFLIVLVAAVGLVSFAMQAQQVMNTLDEISRQLESVDWATMSAAVDNVAVQLQEADFTEIVARLNTVSESLAAIDWASLAENVDALATSAQTSLGEAMTAIDELDIEGLNEAIADLRTVVEPLAKLMGR